MEKTGEEQPKTADVLEEGCRRFVEVSNSRLRRPFKCYIMQWGCPGKNVL